MLFFESLSPSVGCCRQHRAGVSYQWRANYRITSSRDQTESAADGRDRTEPRGPSRVDWRLRCPAQGTARPGETRVRLSEMVTGLIAAGSRPAAHGGSIMPQWHAPCWRRVLPCPGGPRAAYCAASFIWFCLSQWPLFRNLARSGRQGQSEAAQNKSCFAFCNTVLA